MGITARETSVRGDFVANTHVGPYQTLIRISQNGSFRQEMEKQRSTSDEWLVIRIEARGNSRLEFVHELSFPAYPFNEGSRMARLDFSNIGARSASSL
jgi:hypothetical protein